MTSKQKSAINIVFGAMTFGNYKEQSRVTSLDDCAAILDIFQKHGHNEIDTARVYGNGSSEEYLAQLKWQERGIIMDTKLYPSKAGGMFAETITHKPEDIRTHFEKSMTALKADKIYMFYLHGPDRSTPYEDTLREINKLHQEGRFERFGISNYMSWEVAQICEICIRNNWVRPTAYQGVYNAVHRAVEAELFPCLRYYKLAFYAFNPLGGGFFAGNIDRNTEAEKGSRFDPEKQQGKMYRARYWNDAYFDALDIIRPVAEKNGLTLAEVALRWMSHHSLLKREHGDAILIGASSTKHIEQNLIDLEKEKLPEEVIEALDKAWQHVKGKESKYHH